MSDFVLRGYCKKCKWPIKMDWISPTHCVPMHYDPDNEDDPSFQEDLFKHDIEPVWLLSAKQQRIVYGSDEYEEWVKKQGYSNKHNVDCLINFFEEEPFLIAKILKDFETDAEADTDGAKEKE